MSKNDPFIFNEFAHPHFNEAGTTAAHGLEEKHQRQDDDLADRERHLTCFDEQVLVIIAITAAPSRWLWKRARKAAFEEAMQQVEFYLGPSHCAKCSEHDCSFSLYCRFLQQLLRL